MADSVKGFCVFAPHSLQHLLYALEWRQDVMRNGVSNELDRLDLPAKFQILTNLGDVLKLKESTVVAFKNQVVYH